MSSIVFSLAHRKYTPYRERRAANVDDIVVIDLESVPIRLQRAKEKKSTIGEYICGFRARGRERVCVSRGWSNRRTSKIILCTNRRGTEARDYCDDEKWFSCGEPSHSPESVILSDPEQVHSH